MYHALAVSEVLLCAGAGSSVFYLTWRQMARRVWLSVFSREDTEVHDLRHRYGYNEHAFVTVSDQKQVWRDAERHSAVCYSERGNVWLVTGEPFASDGRLQEVTRQFVEYARARRKLVAFVPTTDRFARTVAPLGFRIHRIGASPYFDLPNWQPRGNAGKRLRCGLNRARRAGIVVEQVNDLSVDFREEVRRLSDDWLGSRPACMRFGWLFELAPFQDSIAKKYFAARDVQGKLVGLLIASPIPARNGWYLEDVLRGADSPDGTADLLVFEALTALKSEGADMATLGTVPLLAAGADDLSTKAFLLNRALGFTRKNLRLLYHFEGLRCFKSKFVPSWWENEYVVAPKAFLIGPRVGVAIVMTILDGSRLKMRCVAACAKRTLLGSVRGALPRKVH